MQSHTEATELVSARQRFRLSIENSGPVRESLLSQKLLPDCQNIHQPMTATAVWKNAQATSSAKFVEHFQTRFVGKKSSFPKRNSSGLSSDGQSIENLVPAVLKPAEMADSREVFEIAEQQSQEEIPLLKSQSAEQKLVATILDWLSDINHQEMHNFKSFERYHQTGVWISRDPGFRKWRDTSQSSVFWLYGDGEIFFN